jgi:hypothetical protein
MFVTGLTIFQSLILVWHSIQTLPIFCTVLSSMAYVHQQPEGKSQKLDKYHVSDKKDTATAIGTFTAFQSILHNAIKFTGRFIWYNS